MDFLYCSVFNIMVIAFSSVVQMNHPRGSPRKTTMNVLATAIFFF